MNPLIIVLSIIIFFLLLLLYKFQRQIGDICRQLHFIKKHKSNMMITSDIRFGYVGQLINSLNELVDLHQSEHKEFLEKEKAISDTYTNLSHDIRTPLTSLDGYFQLLESCESQEEMRHYTQIIEERISSLKDMLEDLFTFTRLNNSSDQLAMSVCDLNRILKNTLLSYYENLVFNQIEPSFTLTDDPVLLSANESALKRMIQNILKNCIVHGRNKLTISLHCSDKDAVLLFKNQISDAETPDISQVFERFYKADEARSRNSTGLGLAISKELVLRMNGTIEASLEEDWFCIEIHFPFKSKMS